ncbi:MAG: ribosome-associated heat shock protein Hsp15 [Succinivibrionaceae bacterium]|nr:ribosome-associated heat shock protein Hsp15 [Succinivibrionaceae bacterium]
MDQDQEVRIDKWLWAARFYRTRSIAKNMIETGRVQYNGQRVKTSRVVEVGAVITVKQGYDEKTVVVRGLCQDRRCFSQASQLYEETAESMEKRQRNAEARRLNALFSPHPEDKPDKKQRRELLKLKNSFGEQS